MEVAPVSTFNSAKYIWHLNEVVNIVIVIVVVVVIIIIIIIIIIISDKPIQHVISF